MMAQNPLRPEQMYQNPNTHYDTGELKRAAGWVVFAPIVTAWIALSSFPGMSLISGTGSALVTTGQVGFLMTGFWGAGAVAAFLLWAQKPRPGSEQEIPDRSRLGFWIGIYASVWTAAYLGAVYLGWV